MLIVFKERLIQRLETCSYASSSPVAQSHNISQGTFVISSCSYLFFSSFYKLQARETEESTVDIRAVGDFAKTQI